MSTYLDEINEKMNLEQYNDWYIDNIFFDAGSDFSHDSFISILKKYSIITYSYKSIKVESDDAQTILENYNASYNVLIRSVLDYLLSNSSLRSNSNLVSDCKECSILYFENIKKINGDLPAHNLSLILKWTLYKHPSEKKDINDILFSNIILRKEDTLKYFSLSDYLLRDKELRNLFTRQQYVEIINKFYKTVVDMKETYFYIGTYNDFLKYFKENDKKEYQRLLKKYCDFIFANLANIDDHLKQTELQKVRQYMDDLKEYDDKDYQIIDCELERVNKEQLSKLEQHSISLPDEQFHQIKKEIAHNTKIFESLSSSNKIFKLLFETFPLSLEELRKNYEDSKKGLFALFKENFLDQDGRVINFNELSDEQNFSLKVTQNIGLRVDIYFDLIFKPFFNTFKMDDEAKKTIRDIFSNNKLVDQSRTQLLSDLFISFFEGNYKNSIFDTILELEESVRHYLKQCGLNIMKRDGSGDYIGLNNIFNDNKKNSFRDELLKIIDEDYYFTLKWFLTDEYGFDIRDKISHRLKSVDLYKTKFAIYISLHIFRLYWGFQK